MTTQAWALRCRDGALRAEHGEVVAGETEQCAREAGEFMDEAREGRPWACGPHTEVVSVAARQGEGAR